MHKPFEAKMVYICGRGAGMSLRKSSGFGVRYMYCTRERMTRRAKEQLRGDRELANAIQGGIGEG